MAIKAQAAPAAAAAKPARPQKWDFEERLRGARDTTHFNIEKKTRFAARFFQMVLTVLAYIFYGNLVRPMLDTDIENSTMPWILSTLIITPFLAGFNLMLYVASIFGKKWTSRRVLAFETFIDLGVVITFMVHGIMLAQGYKRICIDAAIYTGCGTLNLFVFWLFFLMVAWMVGFAFDCIAWYRGVFKKQEVSNDVLMDVRRVTRSRF